MPVEQKEDPDFSNSRKVERKFFFLFFFLGREVEGESTGMMNLDCRQFF